MIGIFDSGLGGLKVAKEIMRELPREKIIYLGDTARGPYGNKSVEEVSRYALQNTRWLIKKRVKAVVVGCNTASAVAGLALRREFPNIPIVEVVSPAVREALRVSSAGRIGVIATRTTIQSGAYQRWLPNCVGRACPMFVPLVEGGCADDQVTREIAGHYLNDMKKTRCDTVILGCTHYPFLKPVLSRIMGNHVKLVDSAETAAKEGADWNVKLKMKNVKLPRHEFYVSKKTPRFQELAEKWLGHKITLKLAKI